MPSAFISRNITEQSPFYQLLTKQGFEVSGQSFIAFEKMTFDNLLKADWLFFYSKNAIRFFFENCQEKQISIEGYKLGTIGQASASFLKKYKKTADFTGTGEPRTTAKQFLEIAKGKKVIFPRAMNSRKSIQELLKEEVQVIDLVVYSNQPVPNIKKQNEEYLVFTSPMNAEAYLKSHDLLEYQQIVAIGQTTTNAITTLGFQQVSIADTPSEESLAATITKIASM